MRTLQPLQTSLTLSLIVIIFVTFLSDRHIWVHDNNVELLDNNVELRILTNSEVTFSKYLQLNMNKNLPATTAKMSLENTESYDESFATARDLVSDDEDDYSTDESTEELEEETVFENEEEVVDFEHEDDHEGSEDDDEAKLYDTVPAELNSPIRSLAT